LVFSLVRKRLKPCLGYKPSASCTPGNSDDRGERRKRIILDKNFYAEKMFLWEIQVGRWEVEIAEKFIQNYVPTVNKKMGGTWLAKMKEVPDLLVA